MSREKMKNLKNRCLYTVELEEEKFLNYRDASETVAFFEVKTEEEYHQKRRIMSPKLPTSPHLYYGEQWVDWDHFLQLGYLSYEEAKDVLKEHNLTNFQDYLMSYEDIHAMLPPNPMTYYKDNGWVNWADFLGCGENCFTYQEAREVIKKAGLKNRYEYDEKYCEIDKRLPDNPRVFYAWKGWEGWSKFLGVEKPNHLNEEESELATAA